MSKLKSLINWTPSRYDRLAKNYDRFAEWFFPIGEQGRERVTTGLVSGQILDVACGTGVLLESADRSGVKCLGVDTSRGMLLEAKKKVPAADLAQASFYALPFENDQFDYVVETNAVSGADIQPGSVLKEMLRVCKTGGELRLSDYGDSGRKGIIIRILVLIGILFGDYPHDYRKLFTEIGQEAQIEDLGWGGMYHYIQVVKEQG